VLYEYQFMAIEHVDAAVLGAQTAAHNMVNLETGRRPHLPLPQFLVRPVRRQHQGRRRVLLR
jgi:3-phenylpropionate/trans-cinnamate dioxygenase ferredoxin reductase subunit